jgi:hypothetical protein
MHDPIRPLLESGDAALRFFVERDLLGRAGCSIEEIWALPEPSKLLRQQLPNGSWKPAKAKPAAGEKYELTETWRQFRHLVDQYEMTKAHPSVAKAVEYLFSCQSEEGDIRGILANQYAPYYTGAILSLLIKAGYEDDPRTENGMRWLLEMRQADGGWVIGSPGMVHRSWKETLALTSAWGSEPEKGFDRSLPFSAAGTGMALRAFAAHSRYRKSEETRRAACLLKSKFFKKDNWSWLGHPDYWLRFQFPYWWNHLVSALDSISMIGLPKDDPDIEGALRWLIRNQEENGLWKLSYSKLHKESGSEKALREGQWISLCVCRIFRRLYDR